MNHQRGFTLMELIITMVIIGILTAIAIPNYTAYIQRSNRSDARNALLEAAAWMERWRTQTGVYRQCTGYADSGAAPAVYSSPAGRHGEVHDCGSDNRRAGHWLQHYCHCGRRDARLMYAARLPSPKLARALLRRVVAARRRSAGIADSLSSVSGRGMIAACPLRPMF